MKLKRTLSRINFSIAVTGLLLLVLFNSCKKENLCDCVKRTGEESSLTRDVSMFENVEVHDKVEVYLEEGPAYQVRIEGGKNVIKLIKTDVDNGTLVIKNDNKCNFMRSYKRKIKVYVTTPRYKFIVHDGVGTIYCSRPLKSDSIEYRVYNSGDLHLDVDNTHNFGKVNGMGDIYMGGKTDYHLVYVHGEGWVNAKDLQAKVSDLVLKTSGLTYVNASQALIVLIERTGDVYYNGDPSVVNLKRTGSGQLIKGY